MEMGDVQHRLGRSPDCQKINSLNKLNNQKTCKIAFLFFLSSTHLIADGLVGFMQKNFREFSEGSIKASSAFHTCTC